MKAEIFVRLKPSVLDPQGKAIENSLKSLGVAGIASVRQGKVFDVELNVADEAQAKLVLNDISAKLLANTVIEDFRIDLKNGK